MNRDPEIASCGLRDLAKQSWASVITGRCRGADRAEGRGRIDAGPEKGATAKVASVEPRQPQAPSFLVVGQLARADVAAHVPRRDRIRQKRTDVFRLNDEVAVVGGLVAIAHLGEIPRDRSRTTMDRAGLDLDQVRVDVRHNAGDRLGSQVGVLVESR